MRQSLTVSAGLFLVTVFILAGCRGIEGPPQISSSPTVFAPRLAEAVQVDGVLNEAVWQSAPVYPLVLDAKSIQNGGRVRESGHVQLCQSDTHIYVAFTLVDRDVIARGNDQEKHHYLTGDVAEVFVASTEGDVYWELHATPTGKTRAYVFPSAGYLGMRDPLDAGFAIQTAVHIDGTLNKWTDTDTGWTVEVAIPLDRLTNMSGNRIPPGSLRILCGRYNYGRHLSSKEITMFPSMPVTWFHMTGRYAELVVHSGTESP